MITPINTILFATNLTENCRPALDMAASLATRYQATIIFLHVLNKLPAVIEARLKSMVGEEAWRDMVLQHTATARASLVGKRSTTKLIRKALEHFCVTAGIDEATCGYHSKEIVVDGGEISESIIKHAKKYKADLVIMGAREGFLSDNRIGHVIKSVMRHSHSPVMVVPKIDN